jgi:hypothetical protein
MPGQTRAKAGAAPARWRPVASLALILFGPGLGHAVKYLGPMAWVALPAAGTLALLVLGHRVGPWLLRHLDERRAGWLGLATLVALALLFAAVYPIADAGRVGGGSDLDDELNAAVRALLTGRSPYGPLTELGNPVDLWPGEILLAAPFVLLGSSAYQNLFWVAALGVAARGVLASGPSALLLIWTLVLGCPAALQQILTGGDRLVNTTHVLIAALLLAGELGGARQPGAARAGAVLLGLGLASRLNFALLLPLLAVAVRRRWGARRGAALLGLCLGTLAAVTVPFYLADPVGFPFAAQGRVLGRHAGVLPHADLIVPALAVLAALALARSSRVVGVTGLLGACALVQAIPVAGLVLLASLSAGQPDLRGLDYAVFCLPFGALAVWPRFLGAGPGPGYSARNLKMKGE